TRRCAETVQGSTLESARGTVDSSRLCHRPELERTIQGSSSHHANSPEVGEPAGLGASRICTGIFVGRCNAGGTAMLESTCRTRRLRRTNAREARPGLTLA